MSNRLQRQIIKDALDNPDLLSPWENERIEEWSDYDDDYEFSDKQNKILNQIGHKIARENR